MKKKCYLCIGFLFVLTTVNLKAQNEKVDLSIVSKIKDEAFNRSKVMDILFNLSDVSGPRLTGSANLKNAQELARKQLQDWGMVNANLELWGGFGKGWEIQKSYMAMTVPYYQQLSGTPKAWTPGTNGPVHAAATLLKADNEEELEKYKGKLEGKIIVIASGTEIKPGLKPEFKRYSDEELKNLYLDKSIASDLNENNFDRAKYRAVRSFRQKRSEFLIAEKALAVTGARGGAMGTYWTSNGASYAADAKPVLPELEMSPEHVNRLVRLLEAGKAVEIEMEIKTAFNDKDTLQYNVTAEIPGTDKNLKNEVVMMGAHLDSWHAATGATDNAAGCAVMMEVMRILKTLDLVPRRTIRIALWSGEEQGLLGSEGYVKNHFAEPGVMVLKPEHKNISAYYNLDNGGGKIRGIYLQGNDALRPMFEAWLEPFDDLGATTVTTRNTGGTDHLSFDAVGIPGLQFIQDEMDYDTKTHHTNMDTYDRIQKTDLMQCAAIIAFFVYNTAMRDEKLIRKPLPKPEKK
ncbi:MAG: M20/M25/M40 family metallo-hydrolase [Bacteroidia bacterium]